MANLWGKTLKWALVLVLAFTGFQPSPREAGADTPEGEWVNAALNKPTTSSLTSYGVSGNANDGNPATLWESHSWAPSHAQYWQVDLEAATEVDRIEVTIRNSFEAERRNFKVLASATGNFSDPAQYDVIAEQGSTAFTGTSLVVDLEDDPSYRYVRVVKTAFERWVLNEVAVLTFVPSPPVEMELKNVALGKAASSSLTSFGTPAKAADGNASTLWESNSWTPSHTQYWQVDLGADYDPESIAVTVRSGNAAERRSFKVLGSRTGNFTDPAQYDVLAEQGSTAFEGAALEIATDGDEEYRYIRLAKTTFEQWVLNEVAVYANVPKDVTPPAVPSGLVAAGRDGGVYLTWTANSEEDLKGYYVREEAGEAEWFVPPGSSSLLVPNLDNGTPYEFSIRAEDADGNASAQSAAEEATPGTNPVQATYYVSPNAAGSRTGTLADPFASLGEARSAVRLINGNMTGSILVVLRGGQYMLDETFTLGTADGGTNGFPVVYASYPNEEAVLNGGSLVDDWTQVGSGPIWKAEAEPDDFRQLYVNGERKRRAGTEAEVTGVDWYKVDGEIEGIVVDDDVLDSGVEPDGLDLHWALEWRNFFLPVEDVFSGGTGRTVIQLKQPYLDEAMELGPRVHSPAFNKPFYVEHAYELLDSPGEWYFDRTAGEVYYWPEGGEDLAEDEVYVPAIEQLLKINGASLGNKAKNLQFKDLVFAYSTWTAPTAEGAFGWQSELLKRPASLSPSQLLPAAVELNAADNIRFEGNRFTHLGAAGIGLHDGVWHSDFEGNAFLDISDTAMTMGYAAQEFATAEITRYVGFRNNLVHDVGVEFWSAPGIQAFYVEDTDISHNDLSNLPYSGIAIGWGWQTASNHGGNRVANNRIENVMKRTRDGGGIYTLGGQRDSVVSGNYIKSLHDSQAGLYTDEGTVGYTLENNVIENAPKWLQKNDTRYIVAKDNYATTAADSQNGNPATSSIEAPDVYEDADWPAEALAIIAGAGLQPAYAADLLSLLPAQGTNAAPSVSAGADQSVDLTDTAQLAGSASDDGYPYDYLALQWDVVSGPSPTMITDPMTGKTRSTAVTFYHPDGADTQAAFAVPGTYVLRLTATDGSLSASDTVEIEVDEGALFTTLENAAEGATATASAYYQSNPNYAPSQAVDGDVDTDWGTGNDSGFGWLAVDLGEPRDIRRIEVVTRQLYDQPWSNNNFAVQVSNDPSFATYVAVGDQGPMGVPHQATWTVNLQLPAEYRYARYERTSRDIGSAFAELRVYAAD